MQNFYLYNFKQIMHVKNTSVQVIYNCIIHSGVKPYLNTDDPKL